METQRRNGILGSHPYFDIRHNQNGSTLSPGKFHATHFCWRLTVVQSHRMITEETGHLKISKNPTENRARDFPSCGAVPQPTAPSRHRATSWYDFYRHGAHTTFRENLSTCRNFVIRTDILTRWRRSFLIKMVSSYCNDDLGCNAHATEQEKTDYHNRPNTIQDPYVCACYLLSAMPRWYRSNERINTCKVFERKGSNTK